jgi:uncharacterized protein (TIGR03067 family)
MNVNSLEGEAAKPCEGGGTFGRFNMRVVVVNLSAALAALFIGLSGASGGEKDEEKIQGNWTVVSREFIGKKTPEAELKALKVIIKDGTITMADGKKKEKMPYKLDPSKKPKAIDLANTGIENKETTLAIYELDGDTLKICWSEKDPENRATKFASDKDSGQSMIVLKREKKDK